MKKIIRIALFMVAIFLAQGLLSTQTVSAGDCINVADSAGLVPCGKTTNDPATTWNECAPCGPCSLILMMQIIVEFLVKISAFFATLALVAGGLLYVVAAGQSSLINRAKTMIKYTLVGFIIVFIAWVVVDSLLMTFGYIDPMDGVWHAAC